MKVKRICPICKTKKFKKTSEAGLVCKYGHQVLGFQEEHGEETAQVVSRRRKKVRTIMENDINSKRSPAQQRSDFIRIFQFALQVLTRSIIQDLGFPSQLENIVRELWILYLSGSKRTIEEAYIFEANEKEGMMRDASTRRTKLDEKIKEEEKELEQVDDEDSSNEESDEDVKKENEHHSFQNLRARRLFEKEAVPVKWPTLKYSMTLSIIYLACLQLNYPVLLNDLLRWAKTGQIPYLEIQNYIPGDLLSLLSLQISNSMTRIPAHMNVIVQTQKIMKCYHHYCKIEFVPLNAPLYLSRFCSQFFLTVEGYFYAKLIFKSYLKKHKVNFSNPIHSQWRSHPTTVLMACVIVAAKFIYGVGHGSSDNLHVSKYNVDMTKEKWLELIHKNLTQLKNYKEKRQNLDYIIEALRNRSIASRMNSSVTNKQTIALSVLNRNNPEINHVRRQSISIVEPILEPFVNEDWADDSSTSFNTIDEGQVYYVHKHGFRPQDYVDLIALASEILGEKVNPAIEDIVETIENTFVLELKAKGVPEKQYNDYF
ncbi:uncharacterized protein BX663DRAFT_469103 [Cokeromyces recurvatus]|uniref:uncharacterized protein n=1 Tax=Cokeromyces recurvatus TaxID=90255 RepID=UPI00221EB8A6|nr:uncharacterized protein BX663DRAFT_469103 [Cokeromyces recurvatus]KAI7905237.1 hypothetical protein BX663DRAFT_469103 [Cokeromyces recurvatus]